MTLKKLEKALAKLTEQVKASKDKRLVMKASEDQKKEEMKDLKQQIKDLKREERPSSVARGRRKKSADEPRILHEEESE